MVRPNAAGDGDDEDDEGLDNAWEEEADKTDESEDGSDGDESEGFDDGARISTSSIHDEDINVEDDIGDINDSTSSSDLSDAEIEDGDTASNEDDVEVSTANITEEDVKGEGEKFGFAGEEDAETDEDEGRDEDNTEIDGLGDLDKGGGMADDINNGVASLGVVGIEDDERQEELRDDFFQTARDFRLGYYGEECVEEYFLSDGADDVSPVWGLVFASMVCAAIFAFKRPDTEELGGKVSDAIGNIGEGIGGAS